MRDFRNIKAWQFADDLVVAIYKATRDHFPDDERFGLTSQIRRAAVSVASNIAEGAKRRYKRDFLRFLDMANGSIGEVEYQLHLAERLGYLDAATYSVLAEKQKEVARTLHGLIVAVEREALGPIKTPDAG